VSAAGRSVRRTDQTFEVKRVRTKRESKRHTQRAREKDREAETQRKTERKRKTEGQRARASDLPGTKRSVAGAMAHRKLGEMAPGPGNQTASVSNRER
jgi:hypothetical protein